MFPSEDAPVLCRLTSFHRKYDAILLLYGIIGKLKILNIEQEQLVYCITNFAANETNYHIPFIICNLMYNIFCQIIITK